MSSYGDNHKRHNTGNLVDPSSGSGLKAAGSARVNENRVQETRISIGRELPANCDAERAVLSAILLNEENFALVSDFLLPQDYYFRPHQLICQALIDLSSQNKRIDLVTLQNHLASRNQLEEIGGIVYLLDLQEDIPAVGLIEQHAQIVKDKSLLRNLITTSSGIISSCYDHKGRELEEILDNAEQSIFQIAHRKDSKSFLPFRDILNATFKRLSALSQREGITGITSGFSKFDEMTSGMQKGDLLILAARPSMGKTALALNIACNAQKAGHAVGMFSLEMSSDQLAMRILSAESRIPHHYIRNASVTSDEWNVLTNTAAEISEAKLYIDDTPTISIMELRSRARKLKAKHNIELLVIDYLQLISGDSQRHENRTQEISQISRCLKALAKELDIAVLALSQLSRSLEARIDKRPMLSDLRESGAIEQDGDVIFFVYRDIVYNRDTEHPDLAEIIIGKQRNGPTGAVTVRFANDITRFEDVHEG